jgi:hypothetical protein
MKKEIRNGKGQRAACPVSVPTHFVGVLFRAVTIPYGGGVVPFVTLRPLRGRCAVRAATEGSVRAATAGMYAFGDFILFVGVFVVLALFPTGLTLYFFITKFLTR